MNKFWNELGPAAQIAAIAIGALVVVGLAAAMVIPFIGHIR